MDRKSISLESLIKRGGEAGKHPERSKKEYDGFHRIVFRKARPSFAHHLKQDREQKRGPERFAMAKVDGDVKLLRWV